MIQTIKNVFKSSWNVRFEINPIRWRIRWRVSSFGAVDIDAFIVFGPLGLRVDLIPAA